MSTQSAHQDRAAAHDRSAIAQQLRMLFRPVQFVGFWSAVVLPLVLFPLLLSGLASQHLLPFTALLTANVFGLVVGRDYNRE